MNRSPPKLSRASTSRMEPPIAITAGTYEPNFSRIPSSPLSEMTSGWSRTSWFMMSPYLITRLEAHSQTGRIFRRTHSDSGSCYRPRQLTDDHSRSFPPPPKRVDEKKRTRRPGSGTATQIRHRQHSHPDRAGLKECDG